LAVVHEISIRTQTQPGADVITGKFAIKYGTEYGFQHREKYPVRGQIKFRVIIFFQTFFIVVILEFIILYFAVTLLQFALSQFRISQSTGGQMFPEVIIG
jgi:hypothetical protein